MQKDLLYNNSCKCLSNRVIEDVRGAKNTSFSEGAGESEEHKLWFALSAPFSKEMEAKRFLERHSIETYIPMHYRLVQQRDGRKRRVLQPAVTNLIFAHTTRERLQEVKTGVQFIQYKTNTFEGKNIPIVVPTEQMEQFIAVTQTMNEKLIYLKPDEVNLHKGTRVKIIGGAFNGVEGTFVKVNGARSKRVVVMLQGVTAVATAEISKDLLEVME